MWTRRSSEDLMRDQTRAKNSPTSALLLAAGFSLVIVIAWAVGLPTKYSQRPSDPKSWSQIARVGPLLFACLFAGWFLMLYLFQRLSGQRLEEPQTKVFICPQCHTPQYEHQRKCVCPVKLEPLENWKWV
jgi:hypothetical protein